MEWSFFSDESGISGVERCYTIGAILLPSSHVDEFNKITTELSKSHGITGEAKWTKVSSSYGLINFGLDMLKRILDGDYCFNAIVVNKAPYRKWRSNREEAFYTTYTLLIEHCARTLKGQISAKIDDSTDSYPKQHEVVQIIANHKLADAPPSAQVRNVEKTNSKASQGIQVADMLTGAINAAHHKFLNPNLKIDAGKELFIERMAQILGWDDVVYDTWPNANFNIWHFPIEYRRTPATLKIRPDIDIPFVSRDELLVRRKKT